MQSVGWAAPITGSTFRTQGSSRIRLRASRYSAGSPDAVAGLVTSSVSTRRSHFDRVIGWTPKSAALCFRVTPGSRLRVPLVTVRGSQQISALSSFRGRDGNKMTQENEWVELCAGREFAEEDVQFVVALTGRSDRHTRAQLDDRLAVGRRLHEMTPKDHPDGRLVQVARLKELARRTGLEYATACDYRDVAVGLDHSPVSERLAASGVTYSWSVLREVVKNRGCSPLPPSARWECLVEEMEACEKANLSRLTGERFRAALG
ncbi:hypothetical protein [Streptomyces sp. PU-14G]|uniref:hypothetical protein n=1 Tax=Streptomyces sp. PU-14G TaxID=2800808 RepID=UPI0034DE493E